MWAQLAGVVVYLAVLAYALLLPLQAARSRYKVAVAAWAVAMFMLLASAVSQAWLLGLMWIVALWLSGRVAEVALMREARTVRKGGRK